MYKEKKKITLYIMKSNTGISVTPVDSAFRAIPINFGTFSYRTVPLVDYARLYKSAPTETRAPAD